MTGLAARYWRPETESATSAILIFLRSGITEATTRIRLPEFFARFQTSDTIRFFEERGLYLTEKNGYLYPYSGQASAVLDFFREELERKKVRIVCDM